MKVYIVRICLLILGVTVLSFCNTVETVLEDLNADLEVTETPNGGSVLNYKWDVNVITWSYEPSVDYLEFRQDILYALNLWQVHTSDFIFEDLGENNNTANLYFVDVVREDGIFSAKNNGCAFLDEFSKLKAFSCIAEDVPGRDLESDDQITIYLASEANGRDLKLVLAHETGHALGLGHTVTCDFDIKPIMYPGNNPCSVLNKSYEVHASDIEALHTHYAN